jgi:hypothetical protein
MVNWGRPAAIAQRRTLARGRQGAGHVAEHQNLSVSS